MQKMDCSKLIATILFTLVLLSACTLPTPTPHPCTVDYLIYHIDLANSTPATMDTITLDPGCHYKLDKVHNLTDGNNGLPTITSPITIVGNDAVIERVADDTTLFRIFLVTGPGKLSLYDLTLLNGYAYNPVDPTDYFTNSGGTILNYGIVAITSSTIRGGVGREGGGMLNFGQMKTKNSTFSDNRALSPPGGSGIHNIGDAIINKTTFSNNGFPDGMDAIFNFGTMLVTNSTFSGNAGTGIDNEGDVDVQFSTFVGNGANAIISFSGNATISNSLFGDNPPWVSCAGSAIVPVGTNMDTDGSCGGLTYPAATINLAPLGNYGGETETHKLQAGSPAIDAATLSCLPDDQRGVPRPFGPACDLGSVEFNSGNPPTVVVQPQETPTPTPTREPASSAPITEQTLCWNGPGNDGPYPVVSALEPGTEVEVLGTGEGGGYVVILNPTYLVPCWVDEDDIDTDDTDLADKPVYERPALPTATPTITPTATVEVGCWVSHASSADTCEVPCPDPLQYPNTCSP